jgi:hypothetical protein
MPAETPLTKAEVAMPKAPLSEVPFGMNEVRLNARQWVLALAIVLVVTFSTPWLWERVERFETGPDYRIPYALSKDYWLYGRRLRQVADPSQVVVLGDSVVWGEYVAPEGTLSHYLNREANAADKFINGGVNGLFPLAEEGLIKYYGQALRHRKVIVQCNVLWMTSPKADLSTTKEEQFNHSRLVPQSSPRIPCYKADANERLSAVIERSSPFLQWVAHLRNAYFGQKSILAWTLAEDESRPNCYPNSYRNPLAQITFTVPTATREDPDRGPQSKRHKPWSEDGRATTRFDWVELNSSLQWQAFQRLARILQARGNDLLVVLGPFNEHMLIEENRPIFRKIRDGIAGWLEENHIAHIVPETLPSPLYADASHPLTAGYELLAKQIAQDAVFQQWLAR